MRNEPQNRGSNSSSEGKRSLVFYSDNSRVSERNLLLNTLALMPQRHLSEANSVSKRRRQIEVAEWVANELFILGTPAIFSSVLYDALIRKARK